PPLPTAASYFPTHHLRQIQLHLMTVQSFHPSTVLPMPKRFDQSFAANAVRDTGFWQSFAKSYFHNPLPLLGHIHSPSVFAEIRLASSSPTAFLLLFQKSTQWNDGKYSHNPLLQADIELLVLNLAHRLKNVHRHRKQMSPIVSHDSLEFPRKDVSQLF